MRRTLLIASLFALTACGVDTTGLSATSSKIPHPQSNPDAIVLVEEYGDLQCPACKGAFSYLVGPLLEKYGSMIRFEFRQFPLSSVHEYAMLAAESSECAADQGKFWEFIDANYTHQDQLSREGIDTWAKDLKLDMDLFHRCQKSRIKRKAISAEYDEGVKRGVRGTPTFVVNGQIVENTIESLGNAIEAATANAAAKL